MRGSPYADEVGGPPVGRDHTSILFVCTANMCRSVLAEAIARRRFAGLPFFFDSAGLLEGGRPMPPNGVIVSQEWGFDMSRHVSRRASTHNLRGWDVILTMTRAHVRELVAADGELWPRVFTLPQFVRWLDAYPPHRHVLLREWIDQEGATRPRSDMIGSSREDDIADPVDGPADEWRNLMAELSREIELIASHLIPRRTNQPIRASTWAG